MTKIRKVTLTAVLAAALVVGVGVGQAATGTTPEASAGYYVTNCDSYGNCWTSYVPECESWGWTWYCW